MSGLGIGINYDIPKTVNDLMNNQYQYIRLHRMQATLKAEQTQVTAYNALQTLFTNFQTQLTTLSNSFSTIAYQANSSNTSVVSNATVENNSVGAGSHTVIVSSLAQAQQFLTNNQFNANSAALNINETLTFTNQNNAEVNFSVQINPTDTLQNIRDNINNAAGNEGGAGVTAAILASTATDGSTVYNLVLTTETGTANQIAITGDTANNFAFNQTVPAADAQFTFDGLSETKSSNTIDDVLDGLSFTLTGTGTSVINIVANDTNIESDVQTNIQAMITSYNQIIQFLDANQSVKVYDTEHGVSGSANNNLFSTIKMQLQQAVNTVFNGAGDIHTLDGLGIIVNSNSQIVNDQYDAKAPPINSYGSLIIDNTPQQAYGNDTTFQWVLNNDFSALQDFFTNATSGFIANMNNYINDSILPQTSQGIIYNAVSAINKQETYTNSEIDLESNRLESVKENMISKFNILNLTISKYESIYNYMEKQYEFMSNQMRKK